MESSKGPAQPDAPGEAVAVPRSVIVVAMPDAAYKYYGLYPASRLYKLVFCFTTQYKGHLFSHWQHVNATKWRCDSPYFRNGLPEGLCKQKQNCTVACHVKFATSKPCKEMPLHGGNSPCLRPLHLKSAPYSNGHGGH
ncbi:hypothetical protein Tco_1030603 [Tanacetum coccineum]|uniref:Uncharacterized protein n=1 Tax=Tanacetum coccineum TaxID=301880 RepID=A0ABQ5G8Z5_9ASTR